MKYESEFSTPSRSGEAWTLNVSSLSGVGSLPGLLSTGELALDGMPEPELTEGRRWFPCILDSMSIFSSFSSSKSFRSRTSASRTLTLSSKLSVYPLGKARRLSLSLVLHSKPTLAHCVQHGRMPSHRIFLLLQRSQAWAILLCVLVPTLMTFIGRMPGILAADRFGALGGLLAIVGTGTKAVRSEVSRNRRTQPS